MCRVHKTRGKFRGHDSEYPYPELMENCRTFVDFGANAVICQHAHRPWCHEQYNSSPIAHGQGNLLFDWAEKVPTSWNEGFLVQLTLKNGAETEKIIPYRKVDREVGIRRMSADMEAVFRDQIEKRNLEQVHMKTMEKRWDDFLQRKRELLSINVSFRQ